MIIQFMKDLFKGEKSFFFIAPALAWQICFFLLPLLFVLQLSVCTDLFYGMTSQYFQQIIRMSYIFVILRSMFLASTTAIICLLVGYPVAYYIALCVDDRYKQKLLFLVMLPFLTNLLVQVYSWYFILEKNGMLNNFLSLFGLDFGNLLNSQIALNIVMFHVYLPFMIMPLYSTLEKINIRLVEASFDLGASYLQTFFRVIIPLSIQGIKTGFFLVYVTSFGEYAIPSLLAGQKNYFVGTLISDYFFIGKDWHLGAAFTVFSSALFIISIVFYQSAFQALVKRLQRI